MALRGQALLDSRRLMKPLAFMMALLAIAACGDRSHVNSASTLGNTMTAQSDSAASLQTAFQSALYFGSWNDSHQTRWLVLYIDRKFKGATYDAGEANGLCDLRMHGDTVEFTTNRLPFWQTGTRFTFSFLGTFTATGLGGSLVMDGFPYKGQAFPIHFNFYPIDTTLSSADTALNGMYNSVNLHEATGDLSGDELMLIKTASRFVAFYSYYEGAPVGPFPSDSVSIQGDTVAIAGNLFGYKRFVSRTFILHPHTFKLNYLRTGSSGESEQPTHLIKKASVAELFGPSSVHQCVSATSPKVKG